MPKLKLTKSVVDRLMADGSEVVFWDTGLAGFGVRIKPNGIKSYVIQYRNRKSGRSRRKTIGQHGSLMSFSEAKGIASGLLSDVHRGGDPVAEARQTRAAPTVDDLSQQYVEMHARTKKRPKSIANDKSMIERFVHPNLGSLKVSDVGHRDVQALHNAMKATPYQANRTLALLSKMFELSIKWGWRPDNPVKGIEHYNEEKRHRWLSESELAQLTAALDTHPNQIAANAIRLQLLTGARIGEVLGARWVDFDLQRGVWIKPSHHTKQKRTEHLPLSRSAITLLKSLRPVQGTSAGYVFPGRRAGKPIADLKRFWRAVTRSAGIQDYRIHDNRHTHASHLVSSGMSLPIVGRLLGHTNPSTTQRYAHLADDPLREAAEIMARKMGGAKK